MAERKEYERNEAGNEQAIQSFNFGGLNTTANPLNIPYEDSPFLLNVITDISGNVFKRPGTRILNETAGSCEGVSTTNFATGLNYNFLVVKKDKNILLFEVLNDVANLVMTKENVFDDRAKAVRPSIATTSELEPRLLFCTGTNKPVQLKFVEQQTILGSASAVVSMAEASRFKNANTSNLVAYVNRERKTITSLGYNAGTSTLTATFGETFPAGSVVDFVLVTWQWWAEGLRWRGDRLYSSATRFNAVPTDQNVAVPEKLRTDLDPKETLGGAWNIIPYKQSTRSAGSAYAFAAQPNGADQYSFGDGSRYIYNVNNSPNPSPFFFTFGSVQSPTDPTTVYMVRRRQLKMNNELGILSARVDVYVDGVKRSQALTQNDAADQAAKNYWLYGSDYQAITSANVATASAFYIGFDTLKLGVAPSSSVEFISNARTHIGTGALSTRFDYNDGSYEPAFGLGTVADYSAGFYPRVCNVYQSRLALCGFAHRPLTVLFSEVNDTTNPGKFYSEYHITDDDPELSTKPFDIIVASKPDDRIITVVEWQASLFILTRKSVFRLHGGDKPISPTSRYVNFISNTGCVNESCVAQTDFSVVYLADTGLYDLTPMVENGEYQVRERSIKVRDKFKLTDDPRYEALPWVAYDADNRLVMLAYPAAGSFYTNRYIYVYNTFRDSWTEYNTPTGFNTFQGTPYVDRGRGVGFLTACATDFSAQKVPANLVLLKFNDSRFIDYRQTATHLTLSNYYMTPLPEVVHTIQSGQQQYGVSFTATQQTSAFTPTPIVEVEDLAVYVAFAAAPTTLIPLQREKDWVKTTDSMVYLLTPYPAGTQLLIRMVAPEPSLRAAGVGHLIVYKDNQVSTDYFLSVVGGKYRLNPGSSVPNNARLEWGNIYLSAYMSPMFVLNTLGSYKRLFHVYLFFDNREGLPLYPASAVNSSSGQLPETIVDTYRTRINANITIGYNSELGGETSSDIYGFKELYWDESVTDIAPAALQGQPFQMFKEPIQGVGYSYQLSVWNYDDATFKLCGYQIDSKQKGKRYTGRF